jgi:hypothetical protein
MTSVWSAADIVRVVTNGRFRAVLVVMTVGVGTVQWIKAELAG